MKTIKSKWIILMLLAFLFMPLSGGAAKKVALIIGNANYFDPKYPNLITCVNDARAMDIELKKLGFNTSVVTDANQQELVSAVSSFAIDCKNADVAVFYYSGHAIKIGSGLYIVPSMTNFAEDIISSQYVSINEIRRLLTEKSALSFLFLDACRAQGGSTDPEHDDKGPIAYSQRIQDASSSKPFGCMVCYATQDERKAISGKGPRDLSPFTKVLVEHISDSGEFRSLWEVVIKPLATFRDINQVPSEDGVYTNSFSFVDNMKMETPDSNKSSTSVKHITINCGTPNAILTFGDKSYALGKPLQFKIGSSYVYTISAPGYQSLTGNIQVNSNTPSTLNFSLQKEQQANISIICKNAKTASVYVDGKYVGLAYKNMPLKLQTFTGIHKIKLASDNKSASRDVVVKENGNEFVFYLWSSKDTPAFWDWDGGSDGSLYVSYHFSPKSQIGLNYLYRPQDSHFSYGLYLGVSTGLFKGIRMVEAYSYAYAGHDITYSVDENGTLVNYREVSSLVNDKPIDKYTEDIDPNHEAKKYDANALIIANFGYNPCNGLLIEAGIGAGYHQDRYYLPYTSYMTKTVTTNLNTGEVTEEPQYDYIKGGGDKWFKQNSKWSPAFRLGAKALIPLDGWDNYFLTLGGGYTFQFTNMKYSSWDATLGFAWTF